LFVTALDGDWLVSSPSDSAVIHLHDSAVMAIIDRFPGRSLTRGSKRMNSPQVLLQLVFAQREEILHVDFLCSCKWTSSRPSRVTA